MGDGRPHHPLLRASRRQDQGRRSLSNTETGFLRSVGWRPPRSGALPPGRAELSHTRPCLSRASLLSKPGCNCTLNSCCFCLFWFLIFPVLCWCLPYGNVSQPSLHICPLALEPPSSLPAHSLTVTTEWQAWLLALLIYSSCPPAIYYTQVMYVPLLLLLLLLSCFSLVRLCNPIDGSPPGSPVPGILQARTLEWVAISFSNA